VYLQDEMVRLVLEEIWEHSQTLHELSRCGAAAG
jgi:hypothetical protein